MIELLLYISGIGLGVAIGIAIDGWLEDWSFKKYPEYWIQWIKEHSVREK